MSYTHRWFSIMDYWSLSQTVYEIPRARFGVPPELGTNVRKVCSLNNMKLELIKKFKLLPSEVTFWNMIYGYIAGENLVSLKSY